MGKTRNPSRDLPAIRLVFGSIGSPQLRFFVRQNEPKKGGPDEGCVEQQGDASEQQALAENDRHDSNIHGISHVTVEAFDDETLRGQDRRGGAQTFQGESGEGFEQNGSGESDQEYTEPAYCLKIEKGRLEAPS